MRAGEVGAAVIGVGEREGDRHLALQLRVGGLELNHLNDLGAWDEPDETAVVGVGVSSAFTDAGALPGALRCVVGQRDPELAALARVEHVDVAGHDVGDVPPLDRARVEQRPVDAVAGSPDVPGHARRRHYGIVLARSGVMRMASV